MRRTFALVAAFSLVEVTLALGVAAFCLIAILGLIPVGLSSNYTASEQTAAVGLAKAIMADLRATPLTTQTSPLFGFTIPASGAAITQTLFFRGDATPAEAVNADAVAVDEPRHRATIVFTPPASPSVRAPTLVRIFITWPAMADPVAATTPNPNSQGAFETISALNRN